MNKLVSVIIVNYNGKKWLKGCLPTLFAQKYKPIEVIVVDNASNDGSREYIRDNFPKIKLIINNKNLGFAEGNNVGYREVKGEYVLFLNNDTKVTKNFISALVGKLEQDDGVGGLQSKILLMDSPNKHDVVGSFLTSTGFLYHYGFGQNDGSGFSREIEIFSAKGACMIFKKEVLELVKVDGEVFDSRYFAYFEETDLCHRVWLSGKKIKYCPDSVVYHKMGATSSQLNNTFVQFHSFKNRINTYIKNLKTTEMVKMLFVNILLSYAVALFFLMFLNIGYFVSVNRAIFWNIKNFPLTLKKRRFINKNIVNKKSWRFMKKLYFNPPVYYYFCLFRDLSKYDFSKDAIYRL